MKALAGIKTAAPNPAAIGIAPLPAFSKERDQLLICLLCLASTGDNLSTAVMTARKEKSPMVFQLRYSVSLGKVKLKPIKRQLHDFGRIDMKETGYFKSPVDKLGGFSATSPKKSITASCIFERSLKEIVFNELGGNPDSLAA
jgi:hypothetical protein